MFTKKAIVALAVPSFIASVPASATVLTYNVNGTYADGSTLSGSFSFDNQGSYRAQFSDIDLRVSGPNSFVATIYGGSQTFFTTGKNADMFQIFDAGSGQSIQLVFKADYVDNFSLRAITSPNLIPASATTYGSLYSSGRQTVYLTTGTITEATAAVPEPTAWAMILTGFGLVGAALRYRRRPAKIAYI